MVFAHNIQRNDLNWYIKENEIYLKTTTDMQVSYFVI